MLVILARTQERLSAHLADTSGSRGQLGRHLQRTRIQLIGLTSTAAHCWENSVISVFASVRATSAPNMRSPTALLHTARCLVSLGQFAPSASYLWPHQRQLDMLQVHPSSLQAAPCLAQATEWSSIRSSRGFFSSIVQPDSKVYKERRLIGYSPEQLYEVVSSVQHYSQFVPWCVGSHVLKREQEGRYLEAELQIGFQMISERYTSKVNLQPPHKVSSTVADSALFHHLESTWQMTPGPSPNSTWLSFSVDFAFMNPLYANVAQLFFSEVVTRMMGAFEGRCRELYGHPSFVAPGRSQPHHVHHVPAVQQQHLQHHHKQQQQQHLAQQQRQQQAQQQAAPHVAAAGAAAGAITTADGRVIPGKDS